MPTSSNNSGLRDNHHRGKVADFLTSTIRVEASLSIVSTYFTIYAYDGLKETLDRIEHLDFLFGEPAFINRLDPSETEKKAYLIDTSGLELSAKLRQKRAARDCAAWIEQKVDIKTIRQSNLLHGKMYHIANGGVADAIMGSSNFTVAGLGLGAAENNIELNLIADSNRDRTELKQWFDEIWNDRKLVKDVKEEVLRYLQKHFLLCYLEANLAELEEAGDGLYAVVPPMEDLFVKARPGAIFLLRHKLNTGPGAAKDSKPADSSKLNPLAPYYLVYVHDDGTVRFSFAQPKESIFLLRDIALAEPHRGHLDILASFAVPNLVHPQQLPINNFDALHAAWEESFNVELLNKRFYRELANWYFWALPQVEFLADIEKDDEKRLIDACVMECYFREHMAERDLLFLDDLEPHLRGFV